MSKQERPLYFTRERKPVYGGMGPPPDMDERLRQQQQRDFELAQSLEPRRKEIKGDGYPPEVEKLIKEMRVRQAEQDRQPPSRGKVIEMPKKTSFPKGPPAETAPAEREVAA